MALDSDKMFYSIGEVAQHFNLNESNLRFWESQFRELSPRKNAKGVRFYTQKDIKDITLIYHLLKEKGLTIEGAKKILKNNRENITKTHEVIERLKSIRAEINAIIDEM